MSHMGIPFLLTWNSGLKLFQRQHLDDSIADIVNNITDGRLDDLETGLSTAQTDIGNLQGSVGQLQTDVGVLDGRVDTLESGLSNLTNTVSNLDVSLTNLQGNVDALSQTVYGHQFLDVATSLNLSGRVVGWEVGTDGDGNPVEQPVQVHSEYTGRSPSLAIFYSDGVLRTVSAGIHPVPVSYMGLEGESFYQFNLGDILYVDYANGGILTNVAPDPAVSRYTQVGIVLPDGKMIVKIDEILAQDPVVNG